MTHKFDINSKHKLDNPLRREMLPPYKILNQLGLKEGDIFADIGCGVGYFSIPAAEITGKKGIVYAMDIELGMIEEVESRAAEHKLSNIRTIVTDEYDLKVDTGTATFAFICTVLHEIEDPKKFVDEVKRILKPEGNIAIVEWIKKESDWGPPINHRVDMAQVEEVVRDCGFSEIHCVELNENFYAVKARRK